MELSRVARTMADRPVEDRLHPSRRDHGYHVLRRLVETLRLEATRNGSGIVLDVGCGARPYESLFAGPYVGLDLTGTHGAPDVVGAAEQSPIRSASVGIVLSTQQLEHVDDPVAVLQEAARMLCPGGTLLLSTHGVWPHHPDPFDYWRWTEEGLIKLVEATGFSVERVHRLGGLAASSWLLLSYPVAGLSRSPNKLVRAVAGAVLAVANSVLQGVDGRLEHRLPRPYASPCYLVVGRRQA